MADKSLGAKIVEKEGEEIRFRSFRGPMAIAVKAIGAGAGLFFTLYLAGVFAYFKIFLFANQYNAIFMAVVLTLTFLLIPASKKAPRDRLPWYEFIPLTISLAGCIYIIANSYELSYYGKVSANNVEIVLGLATVLVLMEAVRRSFGWAMVIIVCGFIAHGKFGYLIPGPLRVYQYDWSDMVADIYLSTQGIFGSLTSMASGIIIAFIIFGVFFVACGGGKFFLNLALSLAGLTRGGPAKAAIAGSAMFGTISGSAVANAMVTGSVTIPMMIQIGYKPYYAGAIEAIAGCGGQIMPPIMGIQAFVMASMLSMPYATIAQMAIIPAILYYLSLYIQIDLHAAKQGLRALPSEQLPSFKTTLKEGWELGIPFVVLVVLLFGVRFDPVASAIWTIVSLIIVSFFRKQHRISLMQFVNSLERGVRDTLSVANIIALSGVILALLMVTGLGPRLSSGLVTVFGGSIMGLVIMAGVACYILGMGVSMIASYVLVASLVCPALQEAGLPLVVSHFFILYMVASTMFTPPFCPVAYVTAAMAGANPFRVGYQAMRLGIVCFIVPFIIVYNPALVLIGHPGDIALATVTAIIGIYGLSIGIEGYLFSQLNWLQRLAFMAGGLMMVVPGLMTDLIGAGLLAAALIWQRTSSRHLTVSNAHQNGRL